MLSAADRDVVNAAEGWWAVWPCRSVFTHAHCGRKSPLKIWERETKLRWAAAWGSDFWPPVNRSVVSHGAEGGMMVLPYHGGKVVVWCPFFLPFHVVTFKICVKLWFTELNVLMIFFFLKSGALKRSKSGVSLIWEVHCREIVQLENTIGPNIILEKIQQVNTF